MATNIALVRGRRAGVDLRQGIRAVGGDALRAGRDEAAHRAGDGGRRHGPVHGAPQPPSSLATTENLIELAKVSKQYGGIYASHIRDEGERRVSGRRGGDRGRQGREHSGGHPPHEDRPQEAVGPRQRDHRDGAESPRRRPRHPANVYPYTAGQNNLRRSSRRGPTTAGARRWSSDSRIRRRGGGMPAKS